MNEFRSFQMSAVLALLALLAVGAALADHGPGGHGGHGHPPSPVGAGAGAAGAAGPVPQVKYGGPIVYSGEKPPIIHFPPPPPPVSFAEEVLQILRIFPPKDDLNPPLPELSPINRYVSNVVKFLTFQCRKRIHTTSRLH